VELVTHALLGAGAALASRPGRSRLTTRERLLLGVAGATWPDIDFITFLVDPLRFLADWHQGPTHSLLLLPLWALLIAAIFVAATRRREAFGEAAAVAALGLATHVAADAITAYGVMLWYPLSTRRFGLGATFVVDVWIGAIALCGVVLGLRWRQRAPAAIALGLVCGVVAGQAWLQQRALAIGQVSARTQGLAYERLSAFAQPLSPLHWKLIASTATQHRVAHLDLGGRGHWVPAWPGLRWLHALAGAYQPASALTWLRYERLADPQGQHGFVEPLWHDARFAPFRRFATHPALVSVDAGAGTDCVWFTDLRYDLPTLPEVFRYGFCRDDEHAPWLLYRLRYLSDSARQRLPRQWPEPGPS
jgi:inner membrane protein